MATMSSALGTTSQTSAYVTKHTVRLCQSLLLTILSVGTCKVEIVVYYWSLPAHRVFRPRGTDFTKLFWLVWLKSPLGSAPTLYPPYKTTTLCPYFSANNRTFVSYALHAVLYGGVYQAFSLDSFSSKLTLCPIRSDPLSCLESYCQILGVLRGPKTWVSDHRYHWVHQLAIDAMMGYALEAWYCNLGELQLFPFCIAG
jgi:hypothetical protein